MIVSTSDNSDPARINLKMLRTDSLEKKPASFCAPSTFGRSCTGDCDADFTTNTSGLECRLSSELYGVIDGGNIPAKVGPHLANVRKSKRSPPAPSSQVSATGR